MAATSRALDRLVLARQDLYDFALGLDPRQVVILGLKTSLEDLARDCPVPVDVRAAADGVPQHVAVEAYLVSAEALANVAKHARATAAQVEVRQIEDRLVLTVTDDGVGGARFDDGSGLRGLADRAESLGGAFELHSEPGHGTRQKATLPLPVVATAQPSATSVETRTDEGTDPLVITDALAAGGS
jgi:signal transduction histidine kinase